MKTLKVASINVAKLIILDQRGGQDQGDFRSRVVEKTCNQEVHALDISEDVLVFQGEHVEKVSQCFSSFAINPEILVFVKSSVDIFIYLYSITLSKTVIHL